MNSSNRMLYLDLTYKCNQNCLFCVSEHTNSPDTRNYRVDDIEHLFEQSNCSLLHISGGEPTLSENLLEVCLLGRRKFDTVLLSTNGLELADRDYAKKIIDTNLDCIIIPFLTGDARTHDYVVSRQDAFKQLIIAIQNLLQFRNPQCTHILFKTILTQPTISKLSELPLFWVTSGIVPDEVQISGLHLSGKILFHKEIIPNAFELSGFVSAFVENLVKHRIPFSIFDFPWCLLQNNALELALQYSNLRPDSEAKEYTKVYWRGIRKGISESYRFPECCKCEISDFCNCYYPVGFDLIRDDIQPFIRAIKFR